MVATILDTESARIVFVAGSEGLALREKQCWLQDQRQQCISPCTQSTYIAGLHAVCDPRYNTANWRGRRFDQATFVAPQSRASMQATAVSCSLLRYVCMQFQRRMLTCLCSSIEPLTSKLLGLEYYSSHQQSPPEIWMSLDIAWLGDVPKADVMGYVQCTEATLSISI